MGLEYYLVDDEGKRVYELGKGPWHSLKEAPSGNRERLEGFILGIWCSQEIPEKEKVVREIADFFVTSSYRVRVINDAEVGTCHHPYLLDDPSSGDALPHHPLSEGGLGYALVGSRFEDAGGDERATPEDKSHDWRSAGCLVSSSGILEGGRCSRCNLHRLKDAYGGVTYLGESGEVAVFQCPKTPEHKTE